MRMITTIKFVSKKERIRRKEICESCEEKQGVRCGVCKCFLIALQKIDPPQCQLGKFDK